MMQVLFKLGDPVEITKGFYEGCRGVVISTRGRKLEGPDKKPIMLPEFYVKMKATVDMNKGQKESAQDNQVVTAEGWMLLTELRPILKPLNEVVAKKIAKKMVTKKKKDEIVELDDRITGKSNEI